MSGAPISRFKPRIAELAQRSGPIDGREARASRALTPDPLRRELVQAVDDHDEHRAAATAYGNLLRPDLAGIHNVFADHAAERAQELCDRITAATGRDHATTVNDWHKNTGRRIH
jgi:hypothetical protein